MRNAYSRREMLHRAGTGLGLLGLAGVLRDAGLWADTTPPDPRRPLAARPPHYAARIKPIIHGYLSGGPSEVDTFDPKPLLQRYEGRTLPTGNLTTERPTGAALPSPFRFKRYGQSGIEVSELFERTASAHIDDMC